ncbi:hypothetical protein NDI45_10795 [Leptolyngbya sp. GB1-A1]|uniref:hypothetical protein n=1 Tax=Leptolyngbya sp. GB1-A1 TaxID=2933908 RepID=UPI00329A6AE5
MSPKLYLDFLNLICAGLLGWGLIRPERVYQFPFFMGAIFVSFILPQAISLVDNPGLPDEVALNRVLLMCCLCTAMSWIGYQAQPNQRLLTKLNIPLDKQKLFKAGIFLLVMAYFFNFLLSRTDIQRTDSGTWQGPSTIYIFFASVIYIAFSIFLLYALNQPTLKHWALTAVAAYPILQFIIDAGRRQPTITFLIIIGFSFWFVLRLIPPRWVFVLITIGGLYLIPLIGELRGSFWELVFSGDWQTISDSARESFNSLLEGEILELRNAAFLMDAAVKTGQHGYGTGFWNALVFQYVPGQIVGYGLKASLQIQLTNYDLTKLYGYIPHSGSTVTGIGDTFVEFDYFGCFIFAIIAYYFKNLWVSAISQRSVVSALLYVGLVSPAMIGVTHGIGRFCQELVFQLFFVGAVAYYARVREPEVAISPYEGAEL